MQDRSDFMADLHKTVQAFETHWNRMQREHGEINYPQYLDREEWWEQFEAFIDMESDQ